MNDYIELAHRTSGDSNNNYLDYIDRIDFDRVFNGFDACSKAAERLKKMVFYGRELPSRPTITPASFNCPYDADTLHANLGVMGESHEFVNATTREEVLDEGGDLLWYIAKKFRIHGITFEEAMENNIAKLKARYPDRFSAETARSLESSVHQ
jgi:NTP pyrophosphatase (non-canonical NTP hydrolase)